MKINCAPLHFVLIGLLSAELAPARIALAEPGQPPAAAGAGTAADAAPQKPPADAPASTDVPATVAPVTEARATDQASSETAAAKPQAGSPLLPWTKGLAAGRKKGEAEGKPVLVRCGAPWCGWCTKLDAEFDRPQVQLELRRWTLVEVDIDETPDDARTLGVGPIPALRIISADGRVAVEHDGFLEADELLVWLKSGFGETQPGATELLASTGQPTADEVGQLVAGLSERSTARREAAIRRLAAHPSAAAAPVAELLSSKKLAAQLSALELLRQWQAPIEGVDPWRPETLSAERLAVVRDWATTVKQAAAAGPAELSPEERAEAQDQLDRLPTAGDDEAAAMIERLARYGARLLPLVTARLREAASDRVEERLLVLRYRLVASNALALTWPAGLKRLASTDVKLRRQAAEELVQRASADDQPLLLELFSDADPLVREISLRGLQQVEKGDGGGALVKLLDDPDPNVRAAVLKQLAENPQPALFARVAEYAARESDPDLVGHAIQFLKESHGPRTTEALIELLKHPSWQVRADVAEALSGIAGSNSSTSQSADIYAALIELLADEDAFVVSRAIRGLEHANLAAAIKPLARAGDAHPELAAEVVKVLTALSGAGQVTDSLRSFVEHKDPHVRAAAIGNLIEANPPDAELAEIGLEDEDSQVRTATAEALLKLCQQSFDRAHGDTNGFRRRAPRGLDWGATALRALFGAKKTQAAAAADNPAAGAPAGDDPADEWLKDFRRGTGRPRWLSAVAGPLQTMLASDDPAERRAAALALAAIEGEPHALPVLREIIRAPGAHRDSVAPAFPFLLWEPRRALFHEIVALGVDPQQLAELARAMCQGHDPRVAGLLWSLLAEGQDSVVVAQAVYEGLNGLLQDDPLDVTGEPPAAGADIPDLNPEAIARYGRQGSPWQRTIAIALVINDHEQVSELAMPILDSPDTADDFGADALQLLLAALPEAKGEKLAVDRLNSDNNRIAQTAMAYLVQGPMSANYLRQAIYLSVSRAFAYHYAGGGEVIEVEPPAGLSLDRVRPLLGSKNADIAAGVGYLLATLGDDAGMEQLIKQWRSGEHGGRQWARPLYRAIAALGDDARTPILRELYRQLSDYQKRDFYWTIRSMKGPEAARLRKEIRDEVGMDQLR